jgi:serine O-acetyltransferase
MHKLKDFFRELDAAQANFSAYIPPKGDTQALLDGLLQLLFPIQCAHPKPAQVQYTILRHELIRVLTPLWRGQESGKVMDVADAFFTKLPEVYAALMNDASAILQFDPAATCVEEVITTYPGFQAIATYRLAHALHQLEVPLLPRIFTEFMHSKTGIDIHPAATIGPSFFIDHGTGVVIGATTLIGANVKIYQGVTLGALQVDKALAGKKRHPTIGDNCIIYANSTILGGRTIIGHDSVIGGNAWITESVPPFSLVLHQPQVKVRNRAVEEGLNYII